MATEAQQRIHEMHRNDARMAALTYVKTTAGITHRMRDPFWKGMQNDRPGNEPFFINKSDDGHTSFRGGALRQLPKNPKQSNDMVQFLLKRRAEQSKELRDQMELKAVPDVVTRLDEGKMELQSTIENIGLQIQEQLYTPLLINELKRLSLMLLRSVPLLDAESIDSMAEYLTDVGDIILLSKKNNVKANALVSLDDLEDAELLEQRVEQWRDMPTSGKDRQRLINLTYERIRGMVDYLNKMSDIADRPIAEKIRASQAFARAMAIKTPANYAKQLREAEAVANDEEAEAERVRAMGVEYMPMGAAGGRDIALVYPEDEVVAEMRAAQRAQYAMPGLQIGELEAIDPDALPYAGEAQEDVDRIAQLEAERADVYRGMNRISEAEFNELRDLYAPYAGLRGARIPRNLTIGNSPFMRKVNELLRRVPGRRGYQADTERTPAKLVSELTKNFVVQYERGGRQIIAPVSLSRALPDTGVVARPAGGAGEGAVAAPVRGLFGDDDEW